MVEAIDEYDQMLKDFEKRKDQYGFVEIRCASVRGRNEKGENIWVGVAIKVIPHKKDEEKGEERNYNYGDVIVGKYCCGVGKTYRTGDFDIKSGIIELDDEIKYMHVVLISKEEEVLDSRWFPTVYGGQVEFEPTEENLENIIYRGENERVEFKLNTDNEEDLLKTIVAFANKSGGIILIGVDDNGEIKGFEWKKEKKGEPLKDWLSKMIRGRCDPSSIDFDVKEIYVREKPLTLIEVKEGKNKPYLLKDKCPYIRVGSTDRCMTREELDDIYRRKSQETTGFMR